MKKPRIILADTDFNYIIPLQQKFFEEFFEKIDLEIIDDPAYFRLLFSAPQMADILVVSEDLFEPSLQRHNIGHIFLMTEQPEEDNTSELNISRLFKYTSIKEIFSEITGKAAEALNVKNVAKKQTQVILVYSASGGTGKTTIAMGISACLTKNYKKVLYISADRLHTFQRMLENQTPVSAPEIYAKLSAARDSLYSDVKHVIRRESFSYFPPFRAALLSLGLQYSIYEKLATAAKKTNEYDYIIIDADAPFDEDKARLLSFSDRVVLVTEQTNTSVFATNTLISNMNGVNAEKYIFVCNNFDKDKYNAIISANVKRNFQITEYISHIPDYDQKKCEDLAKNPDIQKTAFLIL